jgi:hypothetical protein
VAQKEEEDLQNVNCFPLICSQHPKSVTMSLASFANQISSFYGKSYLSILLIESNITQGSSPCCTLVQKYDNQVC